MGMIQQAMSGGKEVTVNDRNLLMCLFMCKAFRYICKSVTM